MTKEIIYCDRCGRECEKIRSNKGLHLFRLLVKPAGDDWLDLCQKCYDSLDKWWRGEIKTHGELLNQEPAWWAVNSKGEKVAFKDMSAERAAMLLKMMEHEPCEDAISRQAVLNMQYRIDDSATLSTRDVVNVDDIEDLPSVNSQESKTGHWEWVQYDSNPNIGNWHCSKCRTIIPHMPEETDNTPIYKWCPYCGAKMEGSD